MVCIHCGDKTDVINSRLQKRTDHVWRRRKCRDCQAIFSTTESPDFQAEWLVRDGSGRTEAFSRDKLFLSLYDSCHHRETAVGDAGALTDTVINKLRPEVHRSQVEAVTITRTAQVVLSRFDKAAAVRYAALHR